MDAVQQTADYNCVNYASWYPHMSCIALVSDADPEGYRAPKKVVNMKRLTNSKTQVETRNSFSPLPGIDEEEPK